MIPLRDSIPHRRFPIVTWFIIAINLVVFFWELQMGERELRNLFYFLGIVPSRYMQVGCEETMGFLSSCYWSFITSMYLHGGWAHIIGNLWILWIFGDNVEDRMGPFRFLIFYHLCGISAGITHVVMHPHSMIPTVGASGAIAGVLGAYMFLFPYSRITTLVPLFLWPVFVDIPAFFFLFLWFLQQVFGSTIAALLPGVSGGIAWEAHIGGFLTGFAIYKLFLDPLPRRRRLPSYRSLSETGW